MRNSKKTLLKQVVLIIILTIIVNFLLIIAYDKYRENQRKENFNLEYLWEIVIEPAEFEEPISIRGDGFIITFEKEELVSLYIEYINDPIDDVNGSRQTRKDRKGYYSEILEALKRYQGEEVISKNSLFKEFEVQELYGDDYVLPIRKFAVEILEDGGNVMIDALEDGVVESLYLRKYKDLKYSYSHYIYYTDKSDIFLSFSD